MIQLPPTEENILRVLYVKGMAYGHEIKQSILEAGGNIPSGSYYPAFRRLEKKKLIVSTITLKTECTHGGNCRKYYCVTEKGKKEIFNLDRFRKRLEDVA